MTFKIRREISFLRFLFGGGLIASLLLGLFFVAVLTQHQAEARTVVEGGHTFVTQNSVVNEDGVYKVSFNAPEIYEGDENTAIVIFLHYRSFSESVTSIDIDSGSISAVSQGEVIREDEYSTEMWVATGAAVGIPSIDVYLSGGVDDFVAEAYYFSGVDQTDPVSEVVQNSAAYPAGDINLTFTASDTPQMYVGAATSYTDSNTVTPVTVFDWSHDTSTTNTKAVSGYLYSDSQSAVSLDWEKTADWPWSAVGIALRDVQATPPPTEISYSGYSVNYSDTVSDEGDGYKLHVDGPEVVAGSDNQAYVILVHYRSWSESVSFVDVSSTSYSATNSGELASASLIARENEYATEIWVATDLEVGTPSVTVEWTGEVEDAVVEVYSFYGVHQGSPVAQAISTGAQMDTQQPLITFNQSDEDHIFIGGITSYTADNTLSAITTFNDSHTASTINVIAASGVKFIEANNPASFEWNQTTNWTWSGYGIALRDASSQVDEEPIPPLLYEGNTSEQFNGPENTISFSGPEINLPTHAAYVIFVHYRSEYGSVSEITINSQPNIAYLQGGPIRQNEYSTEMWVATGLPSGIPDIDVNWGDFVEDAVVEVYLFSGVNQSQPVGQFVYNNADTDVAQPNFIFDPSSSADLYISAITSYSSANSISPVTAMEYSTSTATTNTLAASGYLFGEADSAVSLEWVQTQNWHWSGVGASLNGGQPEPSPEPSPETPSVTFTSPNNEDIVTEFVQLTGSITTSVAPISAVYYYGTENESNQLQPEQYTVISPNEWTFDFNVRLQPGQRTISFWGESSDEDSYNYMGQIALTVTETAFPNCILDNLGSRISDTTPTYTARCTGTDGISQASFRIYHEQNDVVVDWTDIPTTTSGNWGDTEVEFAFTSPVSLVEGAHLISIDVKNNYGKWITTGNRDEWAPVDRVVIEAVDNRAPRLHVNAIEPNPTTDIRPYLTGICIDDYATEINSEISSIEYRIEEGAWTPIYEHSIETAAASQIFEVKLPELILNQEQDIDVRCSDTANNTTDPSSQTVEVIEQITQDPEKITITENFITQDRKIPFYTDAIWGNGYLRLKELFSPTYSVIDSDGYADRYGSYTSNSTYVVRNGTDNLIWYVKEDEIVSLNTQTDERISYPSSFFGYSKFLDIAQIEDSEGRNLAWITHVSGLILFDITNNTFVNYSHANLADGFSAPNGIFPDSRDGRVGAYIASREVNSSTNSSLVYIDTNGTFLDSSDDSVVWFSTPASFTYDSLYGITFDQENDLLYIGKPGVGLVKVSDNGTPTNTSDYYGPIVYEADAQVTDSVVDSTTNSIFFITAAQNISSLFVITDMDSDPWDVESHTVTKLATAADFEYQHLYDLVFLEGPEYIGNQLFMGTAQGRLYYYNTNNTYTSVHDDTILSLDLTNALYPLQVSEFILTDYNTLYVSYDRLGLYELDLGRGWDTQNAAIVLAPLPTHRLNINNITLESLNIMTRINSQGDVASQSQATAMPYYTLDDGATWTQLVPGETQNFDSEEYRLRFKIDLSQNPGTTPIVDEFNVAFGAYQTDPAIDHFSISVQAESKWTDEDFQFTIEAQDILNYVISDYSGSVNIKLYNANTSQEAPFSPSSVTVENGTATVSAGIAQAGDYYIVASSGDYTGQSENFTINLAASNAPVPSMNFTADRYTINKGETVTLIWTTQYFDSVSLSSAGSVDPVGTIQVSPESATAYTLSGTSAYGTITSSLTIAVNNSSSTGGVESVSESTSSTETGTSSSQTSTTSGGYKNDVDSQDTEEKSDEQEDQAEADKDMDGPILINLESSNGDSKVKKGEKVRIEWDISGSPDSVYLDYWDKEVSPVGYFEFIAEEDTEITLTATKDGQGYSKTIKIGVQSGGLLEDQGVQLMIIIGLLVSLILATFIILSRKKSKKKENRPSTNKQIH